MVITLLTDVLFCVFYVVENILSTNMPPPVSVPTLSLAPKLSNRCRCCDAHIRAPHVSADRGDPPALFIARATWLYAVLQALVALSTLGFLASTRAATSEPCRKRDRPLTRAVGCCVYEWRGRQGC